jgi:hypothetical protein
MPNEKPPESTTDDQRDAARYRWIRDHAELVDMPSFKVWPIEGEDERRRLDQYTDEEIAHG